MAKFNLSKHLTSSNLKPLENGLMWYECAEYKDVKEYIKGNIQKIKENFVSIGYWLKYVNVNKMYVEDGYASIEEFAQSVYKISKSTAYYLMEINTEFSKNGNSPELSEKYKDFSKSQLQELLTLPIERRQEITPEMTVTEIREMKKKSQPDDGMIKEFCYTCLQGWIEKQDYTDAKTLKEYLHNKFGKSYDGYCSEDLDYQSNPKGIVFEDCDEMSWSALAKRIIELYKTDPLILELPKVLNGQMEIVNIEMEIQEHNVEDEKDESVGEEETEKYRKKPSSEKKEEYSHGDVISENSDEVTVINTDTISENSDYNVLPIEEELFQYRRDIETLMLILQEWQKQYPNDSKADYAEKFLEKLDYLHMVW